MVGILTCAFGAVGVLVLIIETCSTWPRRRDQACGAGFALAKSSADSLMVSRDGRCEIQPKAERR